MREERNKLTNGKNKYDETLKGECLTVRLKEDFTTKDKGKNHIKILDQIIADKIKPNRMTRQSFNTVDLKFESASKGKRCIEKYKDAPCNGVVIASK